MRKSIPILLIFLFLMSAVAISDSDFSYGAKSCWDFILDATDKWGGWDGTEHNVVHSNNYTFTGGGAYYYDGDNSDSYISLPADQFDFETNATFFVCANTTDVGGTNTLFGSRNGDNNLYSLIGGHSASHAIFFQLNATQVFGTSAIDNGVVHCYMFSYDYDSETVTIYVDGILNASGSAPRQDGYSEPAYFGQRYPEELTRVWDGWIGISAYWENRTMSDTEALDFYTSISSGSVCSDFVYVNSPPLTDIISPLNESRNNSPSIDVYFTWSDDSSDNLTCALQNSTDVFGSKDVASSPESIAYVPTDMSTYTALLNLTCWDNSAENYSYSSFISFTVDTLDPYITISSTVNKTAYIIGEENITIDAECEDESPLRMNYTLKNDTGEIIRSRENTTVDGTFIYLDDVIDISSFSEGNYIVEYECADSHTKKDISDYGVIKAGNMLVFDDKGEIVSVDFDAVSSGKDLESFFAQKSKDRYRFIYNVNDNSQGKHTYHFTLYSDYGLMYHPDSSYKAHFTTRFHWIDFNLPDKDAEYTVTKIDNNTYKVKIKTSLSALEFESIGDLNVRSFYHDISLSLPSKETASSGSLKITNPIGASLILIGFVIAGLLMAVVGMLSIFLNFRYKHALSPYDLIAGVLLSIIGLSIIISAFTIFF